MVVYKIKTVSDNHWAALTVRADCQNDMADDNYMTRLDRLLLPFNGVMIRNPNDGNHKLWIKELRFDSSEDLMMFKLTFN